MSATDNFIKSLQTQSGARVSTGLSLDEREPDVVANEIRLGRELGLPANVISANAQGFQRQVDQKKSAVLLTEAPKTRAWLQDVENGALAKDDLENLTAFEKSFGAGGRAIGRGTRRLSAVPDHFKATEAATRSGDVGKTFDQIFNEEKERAGGAQVFDRLPSSTRVNALQVAQARFDAIEGQGEADRIGYINRGAEALGNADRIMQVAANIPMSVAATKFRDGSLSESENTVLGALGAFVTDPIGGTAFIAETAAETLPILAAATAATLATRSPGAGAITMGGGSLLAENTSSAMQFLQEQGVNISTAEGAASVLQDSDLMRQANELGITRGLIIGMFDVISGGVAGQALAKSPAGDVVVQAIAQVALGGGGEAAAQLATTGEIDAREVVIEGLAEMATAPIEVVGVGGRGLIKEFSRFGRAGETAGVIDEIDALADASKLKARAPDKFLEAVEASGMGEKSLYVPADALQEYFQAKDLSFDDEAMANWGVDPSDFAEKLASGGDINIPISSYAGNIHGTDDAAWFRENSVTTPDEMSLSEAAEFNSNVGEIMNEALAESEDARLSEANLRADDVQIYDQVFSDLRSAGRSPDVAKNEASIWSAFWRTMGDRYGESPLELARSMGVRIQGPQTPEVSRRRDQVDVMLNTLRSQGEKALKPTGMGILDFVKSQGGIRDRGGDVEALDVPSGVIAETNSSIADREAQPSLDRAVELSSRGKGLDEIGRALIEAGYFPEFLGGADVQADGTVVDEAAIALEAISEAVAGRDRFANDEGPNQDLVDLSAQLSERGIDISELSNDEIAAALHDDGEGQQYDQDGRLLADTPAFKAWFGDSLVVDESGDPLVVHHGTDQAFTTFDMGADTSTGVSSNGAFFTKSREVAAGYGGDVVAAYMSLQDPAVVDFGGKSTVYFDGASRSPSDLVNRLQEINADLSSGFSLSEDLLMDLADLDWDESSGLDVIDGVVMRNIDDSVDAFGGEITDHFAAFSPTQIKSVHNKGTFHANDPRILFQEKRGSIVLPRGGLIEGETVINLFESADLSTFLHESGHFFLEAFTALATSPDASQALRNDLAVIHKFLKVEDGAALQVEQHETWARGFEAYLMEGKAPSLELASAFSRFKAWLGRIYKSIKGLNVNLTPEIREVMDRMLATDAEISAMREDLGMRPLFTEAAPVGMSDADFATYQRMARRGAEQADASLMNRTMEKVRRETQKWFKTERDAVRSEVELKANKMPVYRLTEMLTNQAWLGDTDQPIPDIQIDRDILVEQFGAGVLAELSHSKIGGKRAIYAKGGNPPELVAEMFGFASVPEMIEALQNAGKRKSYISGETDRIMVERHGDPLNDGSIEEAAAIAVHSDQQTSAVVVEARALAKRLGRPQAQIKSKVYRQRARAMIGRMSVREASRPAAFLQAERRAAKTAEQAFAKVIRGGRGSEASLAAAMRAKEQQILNQFLYREAREFEAKLNRGREKMRSYEKRTVRAKLEGGYIEQIDALLERFDFRVRSSGQVVRSESLRAYTDRMIEDGREGDLAIDARLTDESRRTHYTRMSVDEISGLFDTVANIDHMGRFKQKLIEKARTRDLNESASGVSMAVSKRFGTGKSAKQSKSIRNFFNLLLRVDTIAAEIDGAEIGVFYDEIKRGLDEGANTEQQMNAAAAVEIEKLFSVYSAKEKADLNSGSIIDGGNGKMWTKQQVLSLALNTGNADNLQRVIDDRVHEDVRLTQSQLDATLATLSKADWEFVQSVWDYVDTFWSGLSEVTQRRTGTKPKRVEPSIVSNSHGTFRGGYYPIAYDPARSKAAAFDDEGAFDKFTSAGRGSAAKVADGMTQSRQNTGGGRALNYDFSVLLRHVRDTTRVIAISEAVDNSARILNHESVVNAFQDGGQKHLWDTLRLFVQDVATGPVYNEDPINNLSRIIKNNFTLSRLAFNFKTVALQVTGLGQSAAVIGKVNLLKGFNEYRRRPLSVGSEVVARSAFMAERQSTFQKDIYDQANDLRLSSPIASKYRKAKNTISAAGFTPMIKTQFYVVDIPTWLGAYMAELDRSGNEAGSVHFADRMVDRSQGGGLMTDRNALERGTAGRNVKQSDFVRLWTTLGGYMVTKMNRGYLTARFGAADIAKASTPAAKLGHAANMATDLVMLYVFEAAMMGLAYSILTDEEDDEDIKAFMVKEVVGAGFGGIPFVRESVSAFNGYGAGGVLSSALEIPANLWTQLAQGEADKALRRSLADVAGIATGLPTTQSMRIIEEFIEGDDGSWAEAIIGRNPLE